MTREPNLYLDDILECIDKIANYTKGVNFEQFNANSALQDAVTRRLEIIGEAAKNLPAGLKDKYQVAEWKQVAGMRDILIHQYSGVTMDRVWKVVTDDLQPLKEIVIKMKDDINVV